MKFLPKTLIFALSVTSGMQAMQEVKREAENKEVVELRELQKRFPSSVKFLIKVLGAQKDKKKTLLDRINPFAKCESRVIKNGLPDDLIIKIINNYLWIDKVKSIPRNRIINLQDIAGFVITGSSDFGKTDDIEGMLVYPPGMGDQYDYMSGNIDTSCYRFIFYKWVPQPFCRDLNSPRTCRSGVSHSFKFMGYSVLDINSNLDTYVNNLKELITKVEDDPKIVVGLVVLMGVTYLASTSGITYYILKKLRK